MKIIQTLVIIICSMVFVTGCTVTEDNIEGVAAKVQEVYDGINTIQVDYEQTGFAKDGSRTSTFVTTEYVDKQANKRKIEFVEGYARDAGKIANLWVGNDFYDERDEVVYKYSCPTDVFDEPDFVDELRSVLKKWGTIGVSGKTIELIGREAREVYKIRLGNEKEGHYLLVDAETYLPIEEVYSNNYEKRYSNYVINKEIPLSVFSPPSEKQIIEQSCSEEETISSGDGSTTEEKTSGMSDDTSGGGSTTEGGSSGELRAEFERYIRIYSDYNETPNVGDTINFPFKIEARMEECIGDSGYLNFRLGEGAAVDKSTIHFVLGQDPVELKAPVKIEKGDDLIFIYLGGKLIHNGEEIQFGASFMITPSGYEPSANGIGLAKDVEG